MKRKFFISFLVLLVFLNFSFSYSQEKGKKKERVIALVGGTLIDGTGTQPVPNTTVLIKGQKIEAVGLSDKVKIPKGAKKIDVSGKWILPGFIDCHIHLTYPYNNMQYFTDTDSLATLRAVNVLNMYLKSGVTSVRDVGSPIEPMQAIMAGSSLRYIDTIRLFSCGQLLTVTGGHGDGIRGARGVDGPWEFRKAVREMYKAGFRHIKISPTFTLEEVKAAVDEAKTLGIPITSHGGGLSDTTPTSMTRIAVQGGAQCIEHLNEMEVDVLDLMAEKGVYNVPTLSVYRELYKAKMVPKVLLEKRGWKLSIHETLFKEARKRKIILGIGTDAVGQFMKLYPGIYFTELKYFVELGADPMETIVAATKNGALILGKEDELGTIEKGKLADIQVIGGDPLQSFDVLGHPEIVLVGGKIHKFK
ncbi:MAG: amidohydrolase family protein [Candidatus Aminicenantes bacterium]|nr:MAG: amidohydrolase family protein [Candidatus Aminicenantes bacterium]